MEPTPEYLKGLDDGRSAAEKGAEKRIAEIKDERDEALELVEREREHVGDVDTLLVSWIEAFNMQQGEDGRWYWQDGLVERHDLLKQQHLALLKDWNQFVGEYNVMIKPRQIGRPLNASDAQCAAVLKLHKAGMSLQHIADDTNLGLRTVRTVIGRTTRTDRTSIKRLHRIDPDKASLISDKTRKRTRDALPKRINTALAEGVALIKEAKGLGKLR